MSQEDIEKMLAAAGAPEAADDQPSLEDLDIEAPGAEESNEAPQEAEQPEALASSGGTMSEADIEALLNGMKEDAGQ